MRAYHRSPNDFSAFDLSRANTGNSFGPAIYFGPKANPAYGAKTYEANLTGRPLRVDVENPAEVEAFNRQFNTSLQPGGYFAREADAMRLPDALRRAGFDRLDIVGGGKPIESAVYNPETIELLKKYGLIGVLGGFGSMYGQGQQLQ